jgi:flagellar FliL protein
MQKILINVVLILLIFGGQAWSAEEEEEEVAKLESIYISLGSPLVLNLSSKRSRNTYLQLSADVLVTDSNSEELVKTHIPAIRHQLIVLLSEQPAKDMKSSSKRETIRKTATAQIQELMTELADNKDISDVLFSSFLVQ